MTATAFEYGPNPSAAGQSGSDYLLARPDAATRVGSPIDPHEPSRRRPAFLFVVTRVDGSLRAWLWARATPRA